jgi:hypothetical protein
MILKKVVIIISILFISLTCESEKNPTQSDFYVLAQDSWEENLDHNQLLLTLIEGSFEDSPTLTGSATLQSDTLMNTYLIMNGTYNKKDSLWFALYDTSLQGKEEFHLRGEITHDIISGTYTQFDNQSHIINKGSWQVKRIP